MIYFTSDLHFHHSEIIRFFNRPFNGLDDMHKTLIDNWNSVVSEKDEVYVLGDFICFGSEQKTSDNIDEELLQTYNKKLNGTKYLILGNHDIAVDYELYQECFDIITPYYELHPIDLPFSFVLSHYPILEWNGYREGWIHLYGHVHCGNVFNGQLERINLALDGKRAYNVGVELNDYKPISIEQILYKVIT